MHSNTNACVNTQGTRDRRPRQYALVVQRSEQTTPPPRARVVDAVQHDAGLVLDSLGLRHVAVNIPVARRVVNGGGDRGSEHYRVAHNRARPRT